MTHLSDRIAAEHQRVWNSVWVNCRCGWEATDTPIGDRDVFIAHVADVTERAVRDAVARELEALEFTNAQAKQLVRDGWTVEWTAGHDHAIYKAAELAREGTTPA